MKFREHNTEEESSVAIVLDLDGAIENHEESHEEESPKEETQKRFKHKSDVEEVKRELEFLKMNLSRQEDLICSVRRSLSYIEDLMRDGKTSDSCEG